MIFKSLTALLHSNCMEEHIPLQHEPGVEKIHSGTKPLPDLPPELHEAIINNLEGQNEALLQCALTCNLYRHLAQKILFKTVVFRFCADFNPADRFLDILETSPHIASYVKRLSLCEYGGDVPGTGKLQSQLDESMPLVIPALINLVDLVIGGETFDFRFLELKHASQVAILNKCDRLRSLTLRHVDDIPVGIFSHLQRLETFNVDGVIFVLNGPEEQVLGQGLYSYPSRIKHMKLADSWIKIGTIYQFFRKERFGVGCVESLSIDMNPHGWQALPPTDFEAVRWLIRNNAGSLRVLDVSISGNVPVILPDDEPVFDASKMPLLEEFTLGGVVCSSEAGIRTGPIGLGWLSRHLETISAGQKLKRVTLRLAILGAGNVADNELDFEGLKYFEELVVDKVLSRTASFSITFKIWDQQDTKPAREQMQKRLPTLQALGLLHFEEY
ncbi:hypothetical protein CPC08DRAFT_816814 [Agrocybe pediades]|nr:hypothetical protein CPC08DRAFT_816814 [Agrocybe pediades]